MLQQEALDDYVIATGNSHSVREFVDAAFSYLDLDYRDHLIVDDTLYRPSEVNILQGDASKAQQNLNWFPKTRFEELVREMVDSDVEWYSKKSR